MCLVHPCILSRTLADSAGSLVLLPVLAGQHAGVDVVNRLVELIDGQTRHRVLVAVDGSDAAGKTTFADRLASAVEAPTVRVSVDSRNGADAPPGPELVALAGAVAPLDSPLDHVASAEVMATGSEPRNAPQERLSVA